MIEITKENYESEVLQSDIPVVVDLWGPKCGPCLALLPDVEKLAQEYEGKVKICKLNVAENRKMAITLRVMGVPTFLFFKAGEQQGRITGDEVNLESIRENIEKLLA